MGNLAEMAAGEAQPRAEGLELTIVLPCLNEAETVGTCVAKAVKWLRESGVAGEVIVADNGSTDDSPELAREAGARVVTVRRKGYGNALLRGIRASRSTYVLMADADDSYDLENLSPFLEQLRAGCDLVMGNRFAGGIEPGAMPWLHRRIGNPVLSFIGRFFFKCPAHDFHCGLRGFTKVAFERMELQTTGMEFASEMVIKSTLRKFKITEVPITLHPDGRSRPPHLKPWRDGWRHLRFMLIYSPRWLFLAPGLLLSVLGIILAAALSVNDIKISAVQLNVGTLMVACMGVVVGFQLVAFAFFTKVFAIAEGLLPEDPRLARVFKLFTLEKGIVAGLVVLLVGMILFLRALWLWQQAHFGLLPSTEENLRRLIPSATLLILGVQVVFSSFFMSVLGLKTVSRRPPGI